MAAGRPRGNHEEIRVRIKQAEREVLPAVQLEKKEIRMTVRLPEHAVPSIVMTTFENGKSSDADRIVGIGTGPQGIVSTLTTGVPPKQDMKSDKTRIITKPPPSPIAGRKPKGEQSPKTSITEKTEDLMEYFQDQEKTQALPKRSSTRSKPRTPSPSPVRQSIGLDHLDNLVRLMEQLRNLRDENSKLKNRCEYLESTKTLLQAKSSLEDEDYFLTYKSNSLPRSKKPKSQSQKSTHSEGGQVRSRPRLPSAEDAMYIEIDYDSDQSIKRPRMGGLYKRSFSTGSLEVPSDIMEQSGEDDFAARLSESYDKVHHALKMPKSPEAKRKSKFSKWAKVKKVLKSQQLTDNITSGIKSIKEFSKGGIPGYFKYGAVSSRELAVPLHAESKSLDSGVGSGMDTETQESVRKSTSSGEPPSPTARFSERHIDVPTPNVDDCMGIWLGPPEWIEKEREKEQELLKQSASTLSESPPKVEPMMIARSVMELSEEPDRLLHVSLPRRQSSPVLIDDDDDRLEHADFHRTTSYMEEEEMLHNMKDKEKKLHKTAWGRMKHIMHTPRKDSVKKKHRKGKDSEFPFEEVSEIDIEGYEVDIKHAHEEYLEGPVSRSTPKTSPVVYRQKHRDKSSSNSPPGKSKAPSFKGPSASGSIDVSALLGGVTDDFTKKLQEWEEKKVKRSSGTSFKDSPEFSESVSYESAGAVSPEFLKKLEEWEKVKALKGTSLKEKKRDSQIEVDADSSGGSDDEHSPPERSLPPVTIEEIQKSLTDSFSRKMEEWERQKYRRQNSQSYDGRDSSQKNYKPERQKSKKTKEEKEKEKMEKMREREIMRVEREEQKLEKERIRIEKERLKALEREAKIEKMKDRLSQPDMDAKLKNPILSPLTEYKVTTDFAKKLHEWEVMKGKDISTALYLEARKRSQQFALEYQNASTMLRRNGDEDETDTADGESTARKTSSESDDMFLMDESDKTSESESKTKGQKPPPLSLLPCYDSPEVSPGFPMSEDSSLEESTSATTESMTQTNIISLEKANARLLDELQQKELEYDTLQEDVKDLNGRLVKFRDEHSKELNLYKQQLIEGQVTSYDVTTETKHMSTTLTHLENKITELQKFGEQLAMSMEGAAVGKFQTVEGEESINIRLVDLLDKMRLVLQQASMTGANTIEDVSRKSSALHNFEKLYSQAMQLQVQMNNLRLSQLERNKEIMNMKRHLLLQEANNLLLQADITRREAELLHYKEYSRKGTPIKRWNTFSGEEGRQRVLPGREAAEKESIFKRVQRLRSARAPISSTTDSDSDVPTKGDSSGKKPESLKRRSPKQQRRSPKTARKSPSPRTKKKESPKLIPHPPIQEILPERSTERTEEHMQGTSKQEIQSDLSEDEKEQKMDFSTVVLPTAGVTLPKDISTHEMSGVPRKLREKADTPPSGKKVVQEVKESVIDIDKAQKETSTKTEPKFPELLIPEWKKKERSHLIRMPTIEPDEVFDTDDVFLDNEKSKTISEQLIMPSKVKLEERSKLLNQSFESNGSEDTLKYMSPDASPAPQVEPPIFPSVIKVVHRTPKFHGETASDPGQSRPNSLIRLSVGSHGTPLLSRKPPLGQRGQRLNIPVIPLKRIKPAQELLEDSQKYRSGHSIYLTRILKRYPMKIECRSRSLEDKQQVDKENIREGYVRTMVKQLSREGTPDQKSSSSTPKFIPSDESPKSQSEFVQHIVDKLSKPCGPDEDKSSIPLKDLTNEGQVKTLTQAFTNGSAGSLPERTFTEAEKNYFLTVNASQGLEGAIKSLESSSSTSLAFSQLSTRTEPSSKPDTAIKSNINYSSMPTLNLEGEDIDQVRERSATTSGSSPHAQDIHFPLKDSPENRLKHKVHVAVSMSPGRSRRILDPKLSPGRLRRIHEPKIELVEEESESSIPIAHSIEEIHTVDTKSVSLRSPKAKRKDKEMETIGVLCRQSMTFDLGVSSSVQGSEGSQAELGAGAEAGSQSLPIRLSASSTSSQSEAEIITEMPETSGTKKKKTRHKFLDSSFIQKSRKFFKVSKNTIRVSNSLDPVQAQCFVRPGPSPNCLLRFSADDTNSY